MTAFPAAALDMVYTPPAPVVPAVVGATDAITRRPTAIALIRNRELR
jgi:hypothetical protein